MKAMILAAGVGSRLRPLTNERPKALVKVGGRTLLKITLERLRTCGVSEVVINVHHFADMVIDYLKENDDFGMHIEISREITLLDTGGGLKRAAWFFLEGARGSQEPFLLHNVDVISAISLRRMLQFHLEKGALATLAVQDRKTSRYLLFDRQSQLCGRLSGHGQQAEFVPSSEQLNVQALAFSGIHVISPRLLELMTDEGAFSIIDFYLRLASQGENILSFRADEYYWRDLGRPESVVRADEDFKNKVLS